MVPAMLNPAQLCRFLGTDWMMDLAFCGDDSGSHRPGPVFVVGGYLCHADNWSKIKSDWEYVLADSPKLAYFKMRECYHLDGAFDGWSQAAADAKLTELVKVVSHHGPVLVELAGVVAWDDFDKEIQGLALPYMGSPYYFCLLSIVIAASEYVKNQADLGNEIAFVFDEQGSLEQDATKHFHILKTIVDPAVAASMKSISFMDDKQFSPLQIADLIAWQVRRFHAKLPEDGGATRPELTEIRQRLSHRVEYHWTQERLARSAEDALRIFGPKA